MAMRILWPNLPASLVPVATEAVGSGFELEFREKFEDVSEEQWAKADAVVGGCPPPYIDKLKACRIFVKYGVGYDDVDIERFGNRPGDRPGPVQSVDHLAGIAVPRGHATRITGLREEPRPSVV